MNRLLTGKQAHAIKLVFVVIGTMVCASGIAQAQSTSVRTQIADLSQKFTELEQKYNLLKLEVENLTAENNRLKQEVALSKSASNEEEIDKIVTAKLENYRKATEQYVREQHEKLLSLLSNRLENVSQANTATIATPTTVTTSATMDFSNDFPKNGEIYIVKSGDTLSRIAAKYGSTVKYIQNANKISDPNSVQIGQKLFVPFEKK